MSEPSGLAPPANSTGLDISNQNNLTLTVPRVETNRFQHDHGLARLVRVVVACVVIVACLAVFVPFSPGFPKGGLDGGWAFALNAAIAKGFVFGRDIVFTFGPYVSAYTREYHPATDAHMMGSTAILAVALASGLLVVARDRCKLSALLMVPFLGLFAGEPIFFCIPLVFILTVTTAAAPATIRASLPLTRAVRFSLALLTVASSLLPLIKGNFGVAAIALEALGCFLLMARGQKILATGLALLFAAGIIGFWSIAGQPATQLPMFLTSLGEIIRGYSDAMSRDGPDGEPIIYIAACCLLGLFCARVLQSLGLSGLVLAFGAFLLLFIAFKEGFVRHDDGHAQIAAEVISLVAVILAIGLPGPRPTLAVVVCLIASGAIERHYSSLDPWTIRDRVVRSFRDSGTGVIARLDGTAALREKFEESLRSIRAQQPLPPLSGTTDVYSFGQSVLLANNLDWAPRPMFQSYSAYTPLLLERNAAHLNNETAPHNVLFSVQPIDGRLPSLDDDLSWPLLLTAYEPLELVGDSMAILRRRPEPGMGQPSRDNAAPAGTHKLGEKITLPAINGAIWAKIDLKPTILGEVVKVAYKLPELAIDFHMPNGDVRRFRYIAGMGEAGFIVSPVINSARDFLSLELPDASSYFSGKRPESVSISVVGGKFARALWRRRMSVQFSEMAIPPQASVAAVLGDVGGLR